MASEAIQAAERKAEEFQILKRELSYASRLLVNCHPIRAYFHTEKHVRKLLKKAKKDANESVSDDSSLEPPDSGKSDKWFKANVSNAVMH